MMLLKKIVLFGMLFMTSFYVHGQEEQKQSRFQFGVEIGGESFERSFNQLNQSSFLRSFSGSQPRHREYTVNFIGAIKVFDSIALKSGIGYKIKNKRGVLAGFDTIDPSPPLEVNSSFHSINIPVGLLFQFEDNFKVDFGVELEFLIDGVGRSSFFDFHHGGSLMNPYIAAEFEISNWFYVKPIINFHKNRVRFVSVGIRIGKMF